MDIKPASHPKSNFRDIQSVSLVTALLSEHGRVIPYITTIDKWPNIDGRVEVQDEHYNLIGPLSVQVKTLGSNHKFKYKCEVSFLAYCEKIEPCLWLGVDHEVQRVYWLYLDAKMIGGIDYKNNKLSKTITFDEFQYFDKNTKSYIEEWAKIIINNKQRLQNYDNLQKKNEILEKLLKHANKSIGVKSDNFIEIHSFLDELNYRLDHDFPTIKSFFYPQAWKLGMAYASYESHKLDYALFPIPLDKNDVHIKEVNGDLFRQLLNEGSSLVHHLMENPVKTRPVDYAREIVKSKVFEQFEMRLLSHSGHKVLACEFIIAFIDKFYEQMGLSKKDEYSIDEVKFGFYYHLPLWLEEAYTMLFQKQPNVIQTRIMRQGYFDPNIIMLLGMEGRREILQNVSKKLNKVPRSLPIATDKLNLGTFIEFLHYLEQCTSVIMRIFKKPDFSRLKGHNSWIWSAYSIEDAEYNFRTVIQNLQEAYNLVIAKNFPTLRKDLDLFGDANRIFASCTVRDEYQGLQTGPHYTLFYVKDEIVADHKSIEFIDQERLSAIEHSMHRSSGYWIIEKDYRVSSYSNGMLDFIYEETPLLDFIYKLLKPKLKKYFDQ